MRFLVDAQLPRRLAAWLTGAGYDAIHTLDLPRGNRTPDDEICAVADKEQRVCGADEGIDFAPRVRVDRSTIELSWQKQYRFGELEFGLGQTARKPTVTGTEDTDSFGWVGFNRRF